MRRRIIEFRELLTHGGDGMPAFLHVYICNSFSMRSVLIFCHYVLYLYRQKESAFIIFTEMKGVGSCVS